jgi:hypothetical protein
MRTLDWANDGQLFLNRNWIKIMAKKFTPKQLSELYDQIPRPSLERNDFFLPQIVDFVTSKNWMNIRPEYQRRLVWDRPKKSRFIESLLMNIPVPPIFLFEYQLNRYEVMDGQQRVNTILEFYDNSLKLSGLETWSALNGLFFKQCPEKIQRGLDRRRLSATVLLAESSADSPAAAHQLRRQVFERLNTGGLRLNAQELRNSMYGGSFNNLLIELAGNQLFDDLWGIPRYDDHYDRVTGAIGSDLAGNSLFKRMTDCEIVLRFFAFREPSNIRGSAKAMLDRYMEENKDAPTERIQELRDAFISSLASAHRIFGDRSFKLKEANGRLTHSQPLFDAQMVSLDQMRSHVAELYAARATVQSLLADSLADQKSYDIIVGRPNTATAVKERISLIRKILEKAIR